MEVGLFTRLERVKITVSAYLIVVLLVSVFGDGLNGDFFSKVEAAQTVIDSTANTTAVNHIVSGTNVVFISDQVGYKFYVDSGGTCVYSKTTNGGDVWGAAVTVDSQTDCFQVNVWYDKWTPGSASSSIHIVTIDINPDAIWYNRLDPGSDTLLMGSSPVNLKTGSGQGGNSLTAGENFTTITRGTNGTIYALSNDGTGNNDSFVVRCSSSCNLTGSWTESTPLPLDVASDQNIMVPLDNGNIMIIQRDISAALMRSRIWNQSAGTWGAWTTIDSVGTAANTTYDVGFAATVSSSTPGRVYLAYLTDYATINGQEDIRLAYYNGATWSTSYTPAITNVANRGVTGVAIGIDTSNEDVYVAYAARTTPATANTANVYWKKATSSMQNWSAEQGPLNTTSGDIYGVAMNIASDERLHVSWYQPSGLIYGDTIADLIPGINVTTRGTQVATLNGGVTNTHIGGAFVLYNTYTTPMNVTGITLTENGTIDGSTEITNIKLFYEMDTTAPYDCASESYNNTDEIQFGSTDFNGFSGPNGISPFTGSSVQVSNTAAMCVYVLLDIPDSVNNNVTLDISIANPTTDVSATGPTGPNLPQSIAGTTQVLNDAPTQTRYHWRNDNGSETTATSWTNGIENTPLSALQQSIPVRLRLQVSNEGGISTPGIQYRLEYAETSGTCSAATGWTDVGASGGDFDMSNSPNLTDGTNTTDIATAGLGALTNPGGKTFLTSNGGVKDTSSQTGSITLTTTQYVELEYSLVASTTATDGNTYCFRLTDQGTPLFSYAEYPRATIAADLSVTTLGTQIATTNIPATNFYIGGAFVITDNSGSHNITSITISENGTIDGESDIRSVRLFYDLDTSEPYNCESESYNGNESQFGATTTAGFSSPDGTATFTGSVGISTTATMCLYVVLNTTSGAQNGETINVFIQNPAVDIVASGGASISPTTPRDISGETTLQGAILTQTRYHWRNDNGSETTATSLTGGVENTPVFSISETVPVRLRIQVSNEGVVSSPSTPLWLEYGTKLSTCDAVGTWTEVDSVGSAFIMYNSVNLTDGDNTTDIATAGLGALTNPGGKTFLTPNSGVKDTSSRVASSTLSSTQFVEVEYSIQSTENAGFEVPYCFRVTGGGTPLNVYTEYPELTTAPIRDFEIQRGTITMTGVTETLTAGVDYVAPAASTSAFIRITNSHHTGAGNTAGSNTQNANAVTVYIENPSDIMSSITFRRPATASSNTRVSWEIVEFIGEPGSDNEIVVRSQTAVTYGTTNLIATGTVANGVSDDADVVVFITGQLNPLGNATAYNTGQSTSEWNGTSNVPVFTRGAQSTNAVIVSYAVVEFTGQNWIIQRSEHTYISQGTTETEDINAVNSLSRAFLHTQKRIGASLNGVDEFGHEVWLSSIGKVSYFLQSGATTPSDQTSVAWVIENTQTSAGAMEVTPSLGDSTGGSEPLTISVPIGKTLSDLTNASIFVNSRAAGTGTNHPRAIVGATIASTTHYEIWRTDTVARVDWRTEIVEWPTAGLALRQTHYRLYVDNNTLTPTDPWGNPGLGENTAITINDEPLGEGERLRIRMAIQAQNATWPAGTRAFRLQYGVLSTSCTAIPELNWVTLGDSASSTLWRGYDAPGTTDGATLSTLLLTLSDVAGTLEEVNDTDVNVASVQAGDEMEYDWIVEQNGAISDTDYCFRMVFVDGTPLDDYNSSYPQVRTASFTPRTQNWRWYSDANNITPVTPLSAENVTPIDIENESVVKLRVTVKEIKNIAREDVRFRIQYSEYANFVETFDVLDMSACIDTSVWCYDDGGGIDNALIDTKLLSDSASCTGGIGTGCGTHNESSDLLTGLRHGGGEAREYEFTLRSVLPRVNRVYYFRLYDTLLDLPVSTNDTYSYPTLATKGASLVFTMTGLASSTIVEGVTLDIDTTPTTLNFGTLVQDALVEGAHRLGVDTNGTEGYQILMMMNGDLMTAGGSKIKPITGTNAVPLSWEIGCASTATSCFGYHTSDGTLKDGSARFAALDTYARLSTTTPEEVAYSSYPLSGETFDIVFRLLARQNQDAGKYEANIIYVSVPIF